MTTMTEAPWSHDPLYMEGTERTGEYRVVGVGDKFRVGVRLLSYPEGWARVRVEVADMAAGDEIAQYFDSFQWKVPNQDGQMRFSRMVDPSGDPFGVAEDVMSDVVHHDPSFRRVSDLVQTGWFKRLVKHLKGTDMRIPLGLIVFVAVMFLGFRWFLS